jgi:putative peptidoglycan lipid II flippase
LGASGLTDAFFFAFRIPNLLREFWSDGSFSSALISSYLHETQSHEKKSIEKMKFLIQVGIFFFMMSLLFSIGLWFISPYLIYSWQETDERYIYALRALRIMVFFLTISVFNSWLMTLLNLSNKSFFAFFSSAFYNFVLILFLLFVRIQNQEKSLILAWLPYVVLLGGLAQVCFLLFKVIEEYSFQVLSNGFWQALQEKKKIFTLGSKVFLSTLPRILGQFFYLGSWFFSMSVAQTLTPGSITYLTFAQIVVLVPVGILGVAFSLSSLPQLSILANRHPSSFFNQVNQAIEFQSLLSGIAVLGSALSSYALADLFFGYGKFNSQDVSETAILIGSLICVSFFSILNKFILQACFASKKVWVTSLSTGGGFLFVLLFIKPLTRIFGLQGIVLTNISSSCLEFLLTSLILKNLNLKKLFMFFSFWVVFMLNAFFQPYSVSFQQNLLTTKWFSLGWLTGLAFSFAGLTLILLAYSKNEQSKILLNKLKQLFAI